MQVPVKVEEQLSLDAMQILHQDFKNLIHSHVCFKRERCAILIRQGNIIPISEAGKANIQIKSKMTVCYNSKGYIPHPWQSR